MEVTNSDIVGILHTYGAGRVEQHEPPGEPLWADARAAHLGAQLANDADLASGKLVRATTEVAEVGSVISVLSSSLKIVGFTGWVGTISCLCYVWAICKADSHSGSGTKNWKWLIG